MRYLLFAFDGYYPDGGWNDFRGAFASVDEAKIALSLMNHAGSPIYEYAQIVDTESLTIAWMGDSSRSTREKSASEGDGLMYVEMVVKN